MLKGGRPLLLQGKATQMDSIKIGKVDVHYYNSLDAPWDRIREFNKLVMLSAVDGSPENAVSHIQRMIMSAAANDVDSVRNIGQDLIATITHAIEAMDVSTRAFSSLVCQIGDIDVSSWSIDRIHNKVKSLHPTIKQSNDVIDEVKKN